MQNKTIVCLKYGEKYSSDYVNKLYSMVSRHCNYKHKFVCMTEDITNLNSNIQVLPLKLYDDIQGWWYKTFLFEKNNGLTGTILFLDLDIVIFNSIDKLFEYDKGNFCISRGFRKDNKNGMNSSCFRFEEGSHTFLYEKFMNNRLSIMKKLSGDQDWIQEQMSEYSFWPEEWLLSYKWDMINGNTLDYHNDTSIAVFHGKPKPHEIDTNWIKENWR
jgi:hypothetical protein